MDRESTTTTDVPTTHPKGFFFLFAGEFAERFSFYGMRTILPLYLSDQLGFGEAGSGLYYSIFLGLCYFLPLLGGFIADNFLGKYLTIVLFSIPYVTGQFLVGFENHYTLVVALALLAMGTGVIKPNISTLMGLTYDQFRPGQEKLRSNAFQYFYMSINIGAFLSTAIVPFVRTQTGSYFIAFCVPGVFMIIALTLFAAGKRYYAVEVVNRRRPPLSAEERKERWVILRQLAMLYLLVTFFWGVFDQSSYTWVFFARTYMDRVVFNYELAPDQIQALNPLLIVAFIGGALVYRTWFASPESLQKPGMEPTNKMFFGFLLTAGCMGIMSLAGYLAGPKQDALRLATKEGEWILPASGVRPEDVATDQGTARLFLENGLTLNASGWSYDENKKRASFDAGDLHFGDGGILRVKDGRIDFVGSRNLFSAGELKPAGILELKLHPGEYSAGSDMIRIARGNMVEVISGSAGPAAGESKKERATLELIDWVKPQERVSVWWMALAFLIITLAEVLISVTGLELAFVVAPRSMQSFVTACWLVTVAIANWCINAPIAWVYPRMNPGSYFLMLACAGLLVALLFLPVSRRFVAARRARSANGSSGPV